MGNATVVTVLFWAECGRPLDITGAETPPQTNQRVRGGGGYYSYIFQPISRMEWYINGSRAQEMTLYNGINCAMAFTRCRQLPVSRCVHFLCLIWLISVDEPPRDGLHRKCSDCVVINKYKVGLVPEWLVQVVVLWLWSHNLHQGMAFGIGAGGVTRSGDPSVACARPCVFRAQYRERGQMGVGVLWMFPTYLPRSRLNSLRFFFCYLIVRLPSYIYQRMLLGQWVSHRNYVYVWLNCLREEEFGLINMQI